MAKPMPSPQAVAQKWGTAMSAAGPAYEAGVKAVTQAPGAAAAAAADLWANNTVAAKPKFISGSQAVSREAWIAAAVGKGSPRLGQGATAALPKYQNAIGPVLAFNEQVRGSLPPRGTTQQNIQRAVAFMTGMAQYKKP